MFAEAKKESDIILYIDEIHNFIGSGNKNGYMNVTNIFKPAILNREVQVIGTTTADSYKKYIESDRELMKSFQKIVIEEPSKAETFAILKTFQNKLEEYHQVWITDRALEAAIKLSMQFDPEHNLPAKAIDLMDEAGAHVHIADLHLDGQIILALGGTGYYQEQGSPRKILRKGDVVTCPPNVPHWHGASADTAFVQVAITSRLKGPTEWLHAVSDEEYHADDI